ncbi:MAG: hypothetical protein JWP25_7275 [Bradyrhizobium sp.]|nr:hypothetical protein [Bradyrhizobium sp.]
MADVLSLAEYLASLRKKRWQPGILDCGVFMADWVMHLTGRDPIADVRGTYSSRREYRAIVRSEGGLLMASASRLLAAGLCETERVKAGDVLVVNAPFAVRFGKILCRPVGAICVSENQRAVVTSDIGLVIAGRMSLPTLRAWTF